MTKHTPTRSFAVQLALALSAITALSCAPSARAQSAEPAPPQIMVLGTYHFTGGGLDAINPAVDDYLAPARQREILAVVDRLAEFAPDKIVVEWPAREEAALNEIYAAYLAGEHELRVNERQQIGMRLAARLGHDRLYAADYAGGMDFDAMSAAAGANGQEALMARLDSLALEMRAEDDIYNRPEVSILERLAATNTPEAIGRHNVYLTMAQTGDVEDPVGADEMTRWWGRNLRIFSQIARAAEPGERVLVIYGSGHKHLLDQFIREAVETEWVDVLPYLEPNPG